MFKIKLGIDLLFALMLKIVHKTFQRSRYEFITTMYICMYTMYIKYTSISLRNKIKTHTLQSFQVKGINN